MSRRAWRSRVGSTVVCVWVLTMTLVIGVGTAEAASACGTSSSLSLCLSVPDGVLSGDVPVTITFSGSSADVAELHVSWGTSSTTSTSLHNEYEAPWTFTWPTDRYRDASQYLNVRVRRKGASAFGSPVWLTTTIENGNDTSVPPTPADWATNFVPRPAAGDPVIAAVGDGGNGTSAGDAVVGSITSSPASMLLYLGDIYEEGTPTEWENNYGHASFDPSGPATRWGTMASWTRPTMGNHEGGNIPAYRDYWHQVPDFDTFTFGGVRYLQLNSECARIPGGCGAGSPQYVFVQQTLASSAQACIVAFWHRPVLSLNDDNQPMRPIWKLLADGGGDLVLNGHAHTMEAYRPMNGALETGKADSHMVELISGNGGHFGATGSDSDTRAAWIRNGVPGAAYITAVGGGTGQPTSLAWAFRDTAGAQVSANGVPGAGSVQCGADLQAPDAPGKPTGVSSAPGTIDLSWAASHDDQASTLTYRIYRDGAVTPTATISSASTGTVTWRDSGLTGGTQHSYAVEAFDGVNTGPRSPTSELITVMAGASEILNDRFDAGLGGWTVAMNVAIDSSQGGAAPPSARISVNGVKGFMWRDFGAGYPQVCVSMRINLQSQTSTPVTLIKLRTSSDAPIGGLQVTRSRVLQVVSDVSGSTFPSATLPTGWHTVKLCGSTGGSGTWQLSVDGGAVSSWTTNNGTTPFARVQFGDKGTKTITLNLDDVVVTQS